MERKSAMGIANNSASKPLYWGNAAGSHKGIRNSKVNRNRICRFSERKMDYAGCPVAWK